MGRAKEFLILFAICLFILPFTYAEARNREARAIIVPVYGLKQQHKTLREFGKRIDAISCLAVSHDGKTIAVGSGKALKQFNIFFIDTVAGKETGVLYSDAHIYSMTFSADGQKFAYQSGAYSDPKITINNALTGNNIRTLEASSIVDTISFYPVNSNHILVSSADANTILWDVATGNKIKDNISGRHAVFSPDGKYIALTFNKTIELWDAALNNKIKTFPGHSGHVNSIRFSPDSKTLVSASMDKTIMAWDVMNGEKIRTFSGYDKELCVSSFSPDGKIVVTASTSSYDHIFWDMETGEKIPIDIVSSGVVFSPDGEKLITASSLNIEVRSAGLLRLAAAFRPKGEFETKEEYGERISKAQLPWSLPVKIGSYDADRGGFEGRIDMNKVFINVPRDKAKDFNTHKDNVYAEGVLKYFDEGRLQLANAQLIDETTGEKFALYKDTPEQTAASVSKPEIKFAAGGDISAIPDFKAVQRVNDVAVVIGIENYRGIPKSDYSKSDAGLVKDYLKALGFQERNIAYLADDKATFIDIKKTIETWLPNRTKKGSRVFIYYSGHGAPEPRTGDAYIVPYDGDPNYLSDTGYPLKRLYEKLSGLNAAEVVVILDSCFSGTGGRSVLAKGARPLVIMTDVSFSSSKMAVLSATQGSQISTSSPEKEHGIFTYYFLKALKNGKKTLSEIYEYIKPLVEDEARALNVQQSPAINPDAEKLKGRFSFR